MTALCLVLVLACLYDYAKGRIPNLLSFLLLAVGLAESFCAGGVLNCIEFLLKSVLVIGAFYPVFVVGAIGAGDVKLFGICAGFFGGSEILYFIFYALLIAAFFSLLKMVKEKNLKKRFKYLWNYLIYTSEKRELTLYIKGKTEKEYGLCMTGPLLASVLMHIGGIY